MLFLTGSQRSIRLMPDVPPGNRQIHCSSSAVWSSTPAIKLPLAYTFCKNIPLEEPDFDGSSVGSYGKVLPVVAGVPRSLRPLHTAVGIPGVRRFVAGEPTLGDSDAMLILQSPANATLRTEEPAGREQTSLKPYF